MSKRTEPVHTYETMEEKFDTAVNPLESSPRSGALEEGNLVDDLEESSVQLGVSQTQVDKKTVKSVASTKEAIRYPWIVLGRACDPLVYCNSFVRRQKSL